MNLNLTQVLWTLFQFLENGFYVDFIWEFDISKFNIFSFKSQIFFKCWIEIDNCWLFKLCHNFTNSVVLGFQLLSIKGEILFQMVNDSLYAAKFFEINSVTTSLRLIILVTDTSTHFFVPWHLMTKVLWF